MLTGDQAREISKTPLFENSRRGRNAAETRNIEICACKDLRQAGVAVGGAELHFSGILDGDPACTRDNPCQAQPYVVAIDDQWTVGGRRQGASVTKKGV